MNKMMTTYHLKWILWTVNCWIFCSWCR